MKNQCETIKFSQHLRWLDADTETPISLFMKLVGDRSGILLESAEVDGRWGRFSLLACELMFEITCEDGNLDIIIEDERCAPLQRHSGIPFMQGLRDLLADIEITPAYEEKMPPVTQALYGFLGFGMASVFNPHLQDVMPKKDARAILALPRVVLVFDHLYNRLCQLSLGEPLEIPTEAPTPHSEECSCSDLTANPDAEGYRQIVREIREKLRQGEAIQVVPSTRFCAKFQGNPFSLYRRLRRYNPSPYMFYMKFPDITLFGSSPEVMVRCKDNELELCPIAGTRKRGKTPAEDKALEKELIDDPKDRAEHVMLVDLGRNDLGRIARPGSVKVAEFMQIQKFSHVMHITSEIAADLRLRNEKGRKQDSLDVLAATFPAGTVSGAPKFRAMEIIREMEGGDRGPYAGCIGWIGLSKDKVNMDMGITIRSMWVQDGRICWQAGGGIVHDSDPEMEWQEVWNKSAIMRLALGLEENKNVSDHR